MIESISQYLISFADTTHKVETLLFGTLEDDCHGTILLKVVVIVANFLLAGIILAGTIGVIISGVQILTARDNATQLANGKKRIIDIVIGILAFGFMYVIANFLIPGGITLDSELLSTGDTCPEVTPLPPPSTGPTQPGTPTEPGVPQGECSGNMVEKDGYCYINTTVKPYDYDENSTHKACHYYHSCQAANETAWGSNCDRLAKLQAREMMNGWPSSPHSTSGSAPSGSSSGTLSVPAARGQDNNTTLLCNGTLSHTASHPDSPAINRIAFKETVRAILTELEKGKPITIAAGNKRRGKWDNRKARGRHFITIVGVTKGLSTSNVDSAEIQFEEESCINGGEGNSEAWPQPVVKIGSQDIKFKYIDAWGADMKALGEVGARLWRMDYDHNQWYFYTY